MRKYHHPALRDVTLASVMQALADPWRLGIIRDLLAAGNEERSCTDFPMDIAKATRSHHLQVLRDAGLIRTRVDGTKAMTTLRLRDFEKRFPGLLDLVQKHS
ncbi:helix-turn-helix domain-containing protein [soil metagenome]